MKSFSELQSELRLAIIRGYTTAALEAAEALFEMIGTNTGLREPQPVVVHWDDIQGKPEICDPSKCACKVDALDATYAPLTIDMNDYEIVHSSPKTVEPIETAPDLFNGANPGAFDHDGDGKPGGSKKGSRKKKD